MKRDTDQNFFNIYNQGFARVAVATPRCKVADPSFNATETIRLADEAHRENAVLVAFPELGLTAYTCDDLFRQTALLDAAEDALRLIINASKRWTCAVVVGLPLRVDSQLFNCAAVVAAGRLIGVVPKSFLPNYGEFYEARQFSPASHAQVDHIVWDGAGVPFGSNTLFSANQTRNFKFHIEICEDAWVNIPPSSTASLAGATVLVNLSASNALVGKSQYRHELVGQQSARCIAAYLYASAGPGESTTDLAWDGQSVIYENGDLLAETERYADNSQIVYADIDLDRLMHNRVRQTTFSDSIQHYTSIVKQYRTVPVPIAAPSIPAVPLKRNVERYPFVPSDASVRDDRCREVYNIQVQSLAQRLATSKIQKVVIGVSGGLDSTQALLVCAQTMDRLGLPRKNILAYTMPGFATSGRTRTQAHELMDAIGCTSAEIDIRPSCMAMLKDLDHPYAKGEEVFDITFENVQAGERTSHLFRLANLHNGIVIGTGDLSELALGWCTYGVGDHMSHYNVNASIPKTLISHLVRWIAETNKIDGANVSKVLRQILDTEISPELVPSKTGEDAAPAQSTESAIGPYELQDFTLHYVLRYGYTPTKIAFLAHSAWGDRNVGTWPHGEGLAHNEYDLATIKKHMRTFMYRFFQISQFKRTCVPNGPKVGNGGSLSPRGDWRAPSDSESVVWTANLENIPD